MVKISIVELQLQCVHVLLLLLLGGGQFADAGFILSGTCTYVNSYSPHHWNCVCGWNGMVRQHAQKLTVGQLLCHALEFCYNNITRNELALLAHSLYTCIKLYINDCAVMTIETNTDILL